MTTCLACVPLSCEPVRLLCLVARQKANLAVLVQEDPDTIELERTVAALAGKEAGLFCASGTMVRCAVAHTLFPF